MTECKIDFQHLDSTELHKVGFYFATEEETILFAEIIREELEIRIGDEVSSGLTEEQLSEFDNCISDFESKAWLELNYPDYPKIVQEQQLKMERELMEWWPFIPGVLDKSAVARKVAQELGKTIVNQECEDTYSFSDQFDIFNGQDTVLLGIEAAIEETELKTSLPLPHSGQDVQYFEKSFQIDKAQQESPPEHSPENGQENLLDYVERVPSRERKRKRHIHRDDSENHGCCDSMKGQDIA